MHFIVYFTLLSSVSLFYWLEDSYSSLQSTWWSNIPHSGSISLWNLTHISPVYCPQFSNKKKLYLPISPLKAYDGQLAATKGIFYAVHLVSQSVNILHTFPTIQQHSLSRISVTYCGLYLYFFPHPPIHLLKHLSQTLTFKLYLSIIPQPILCV